MFAVLDSWLWSGFLTPEFSLSNHPNFDILFFQEPKLTRPSKQWTVLLKRNMQSIKIHRTYFFLWRQSSVVDDVRATISMTWRYWDRQISRGCHRLSLGTVHIVREKKTSFFISLLYYHIYIQSHTMTLVCTYLYVCTLIYTCITFRVDLASPNF